jgi:hypothetical protein
LGRSSSLTPVVFDLLAFQRAYDLSLKAQADCPYGIGERRPRL